MFNRINGHVDQRKSLQQIVPLILTFLTSGLMILSIYLILTFLNKVYPGEKLALEFRPFDVLLGMTIYLKTAIDFAIFIGRLMHKNPGWRNRIAIELGTAIGNGLGTLLVLILWVFVKDVEILLAGMIFLASLVLFELAYGGVEHFSTWKTKGFRKGLYYILEFPLRYLLKVIKPVLGRIMPNVGKHLKGESLSTWKALLAFSFGIPFILGLDDFAGYVPLFNIINVFSFSIGVVLAHTLLNAALFVNPNLTTKAVKNEWVSYIGSIAFIGIALYGFVEIWKILGHLI
ncbi:MAG: hypothetical protein HYT70_02045 [Candidatus Aenigmarchaeota archaeon]|nr:hypothetical protein [Candidatus Aenigmarchaeota archaeon]